MVSKYLRTDGYKVPDPKEGGANTISPKQKRERKDKERLLIKDCPDYIDLTIQLELEPKRCADEYLMYQIEKIIIKDLMKKYDNNIEVIANCLNTNRRNVFTKMRNYKLLEE